MESRKETVMNIRMLTVPNVHAERLAARKPMQPRTWLAIGFTVAFIVPYVFADALAMQRDAYYALYVIAVATLFGSWLRAQPYPRSILLRRWKWGVGLAALATPAMVLGVLRAEGASPRPDALELALAIFWRGIVYGAADGLLLSVFPILVVYAALKPERRHWLGKIGVGLAALAASVAMTAVYHVGYAEFRDETLRSPVGGNVVPSSTTLLTASPLAAPLVHVSMHVTAVVHSYETDLFLPPHDK